MSLHDRSFVPWSDEHVAALNAYQKDGQFQTLHAVVEALEKVLSKP